LALLVGLGCIITPAYHDWLQCQLAFSKLGQVQHIIDKALHVEGAYLYGKNILELLTLHRQVIDQEIKHGKDGMQRVPKLVAG
jgi:hypothetical protein